MLQRFLDSLRPNRALSKDVLRIIVLSQAALLLLFWLFLTPAIIPRPIEVVRALGQLWTSEGFARELGTSFLLNLEALFLTVILSLFLSYLTVIQFARPIVALLSKGRFLGLIGLTFIFTLLTGGGHNLKVVLLVFGMTVFFVTSMAAVVAEIPADKFDHARTLRLSEWQVVWEVVILGTLDKAIEILRQNAAIGWMMLTMIEGIARSEGGVGVLLLNQNKHFHLAEVFAIQMMILLIGLLQDYGIGVFRRCVCPYADLKLERR